MKVRCNPEDITLGAHLIENEYLDLVGLMTVRLSQKDL